MLSSHSYDFKVRGVSLTLLLLFYCYRIYMYGLMFDKLLMVIVSSYGAWYNSLFEKDQVCVPINVLLWLWKWNYFVETHGLKICFMLIDMPMNCLALSRECRAFGDLPLLCYPSSRALLLYCYVKSRPVCHHGSCGLSVLSDWAKRLYCL